MQLCISIFQFVRLQGLCNSDVRPGIFRRKSSSSKNRLSVIQSSSCPTSPKQGLRTNHSTASLGQYDSNTSMSGSTSRTAFGLHRSSSTVSAIRPRSSPSGLHSYTGKISV